MDGHLDEVLFKHAWWKLFMATPKSGEGIDRLMLPYLLAVCRHAGITKI
jgi:hypothetical protein